MLLSRVCLAVLCGLRLFAHAIGCAGAFFYSDSDSLEGTLHSALVLGRKGRHM